MSEIIKMAQQVAQNMSLEGGNDMDPSKMDMHQMISKVTQSVSQMVTPDFMEKMTNGNQTESNNNNNTNVSKSQIVEIDDDSTIDPVAPRTKDLHFTLNVTLVK